MRLVVMKKRVFKKKYGLDITYSVDGTIDNQVCEMSYYSLKTGECVGFWAYGCFDPAGDYVGQDFVRLFYEYS